MSKSETKNRRTQLKPNWLPDWRDESQYPNPVSTATDRWKWEFLRRNKEYQREIDDFLAKAPTIEEVENGEFGTEEEVEHLVRRQGLLAARWGIMPKDYRDDFSDKWTWFFPNKSRPLCFANINEIRYEIEQDWIERTTKTGDGKYRVFVVDISKDIDSQIDGIRQYLSEDKAVKKNEIKDVKRNTKHDTKIYRTYLRVWDARETGASYLAIGKLLYPGLDSDDSMSKKAQKNHDAATSLVGGEYWHIT